MYSHELIIEEENNDYTYTKLDCNNLSVYVRTICLQNNTKEFIELMHKYYQYEVVKLDSGENNN